MIGATPKNYLVLFLITIASYIISNLSDKIIFDWIFLILGLSTGIYFFIFVIKESARIKKLQEAKGATQ